MVQEPALAFDATAVSSEGAVGADNAVAGENDCDGIGSIGRADRADGSGMADLLGEFAVGDGGAAGDGAEGLPDFALKGGAGGFDGEIVDGVEFSAEVASKGCGEAVGIARRFKVKLAASILISEVAMDRVFVFGEEGEAQAAGDVGDEHHLADGRGESIEKKVKRSGH